MELRCLVSSRGSAENFDLRCLVRKDVEYLQANYPSALPTLRVEMRSLAGEAAQLGKLRHWTISQYPDLLRRHTGRKHLPPADIGFHYVGLSSSARLCVKIAVHNNKVCIESRLQLAFPFLGKLCISRALRIGEMASPREILFSGSSSSFLLRSSASPPHTAPHRRNRLNRVIGSNASERLHQETLPRI